MHRLALFASCFACLSLAAPDASAGGEGHYSLDTIFATSKMATSAGGALQADFERSQREIAATDHALEELDHNLALAEGSIEPTQHDLWKARLDERYTTFKLDFEAVNLALGGSQSRLSDAFEAAQGRALVKLREELKIDSVEPCEPEQGGILGSLRGPGGQASAPPDCPGEDLSGRIAAIWDEDPELAAALAPLKGNTVPTLSGWDGAVAPLPANGHSLATSWLSPLDLLASIPEAVEVLDLIGDLTDAARQKLRAHKAALPAEGVERQRLQKIIVEKARGLRGYGDEARSELGRLLMQALDRNRKRGKKKGWAEVAICLNPSGWSGCTGQDQTEVIAEVLMSDKKLRRALITLRDDLEEPDSSVP